MQSLAWVIALYVTAAIAKKVAGQNDGSATYFIFTGINTVTVIALVGCLCWLVFNVITWTWRTMWQ